MKPFLAAASLAAGWLTMVPPAHAQASAQHQQQIAGVVEAFRLAILHKDKDSFMQLFLREDATWISATTDASRDMLAARRSDQTLPHPQKIQMNGSPRGFIEGIVKTPGRREETFDNIRIETDGEIAQVWFDYSYQRDGYKANWGKEAWHLVRTDDGWKIASVIWSMTLNPEPLPQTK